MTLKDLLNKLFGVKPPPPPPSPPKAMTESQKVREDELKAAIEQEAMSGVRRTERKK